MIGILPDRCRLAFSFDYAPMEFEFLSKNSKNSQPETNLGRALVTEIPSGAPSFCGAFNGLERVQIAPMRTSRPSGAQYAKVRPRPGRGHAYPHPRRAASSGRPFLKKLSLLGIIIGAALLTAAPISVQPSPHGVVQLSLDKADAQYRVYRRHYRRAYRRAPYYGYGYGYGYDYGYGYGPIFPYFSYRLYPTAFGQAYRATPCGNVFCAP
jgi:hypothetical protein